MHKYKMFVILTNTGSMTRYQLLFLFQLTLKEKKAVFPDT